MELVDLSGLLGWLFLVRLGTENGVHVLRLALCVFGVPELFASKALFAALEVVVLALVALPATFGEVEVTDRLTLGLLLRLLWSGDVLRVEALLM